MKTWGDVYLAHLRRGEDNGSAAFAADEFVARRDRKPPPVTCWNCGRLIESGDGHAPSECERTSLVGSNVEHQGPPAVLSRAAPLDGPVGPLAEGLK